MWSTDIWTLTGCVLTIISVVGNILQWMHGHELRKSFLSRAQASYNAFYRAATWADKIRFIEKEPTSPEQRLQAAIAYAHYLNGAADVERIEWIAFGREHLGRTLLMEHPAEPILDRLPKPHKNKNNAFRRVKHEEPSWRKGE